MALIRVDVMGKPGCHLCDVADEVIDEVVRDSADIELVRHNILDDAELFELWHNDIPVVLIDGVKHSSWTVDADAFRSALEEARA
jgi:hypothetical protein